MLNQAKGYIKNKPDRRRALPQLKDAYPGSWIFNRSTLNWLSIASLRRQLPPLYQFFAIYSCLYFLMTNNPYLMGGRNLFLVISNLTSRWSSQNYLNLQLPNYTIYLDLIDPRFLQVVNELIDSDSDTQILSSLLTEGDTFVDVGANHGSFSVIASKLVGAAGYVVSIEPQPRLATAIERSLTANARCVFNVHQIAVGNFNGDIELLIPHDTSGSAGIYPAHSGTHTHRVIIVPIRRFDDSIDWQHFPGRTLLKLDIEGSEYEFLSGARQMLTSLKPDLILEIHPGTLNASDTPGDALNDLLQAIGYTHYAELHTPNETILLSHLDTTFGRNIIVSAPTPKIPV